MTALLQQRASTTLIHTSYHSITNSTVPLSPVPSNKSFLFHGLSYNHPPLISLITSDPLSH
jgi:hypothetical protein